MTDQTTDRRPPRRGRRRALLASGLVLGIGATFTLAAWTDHAHVKGTVDTGVAQFQANVWDDQGWQDYHTSPEAGPMDFGLGVLDFGPNQLAYAPVSLRTITGSRAFEVTITPGTDNVPAVDDDERPLYDALQYRVQFVPDPSNCNHGYFWANQSLVPGFTNDGPGAIFVDESSEEGAITLAASDGVNPGAAVHLCFAIIIDDSLQDDPDALAEIQDTQLDVYWKFVGESVDA